MSLEVYGKSLLSCHQPPVPLTSILASRWYSYNLLLYFLSCAFERVMSIVDAIDN